MKRLEDEPSRPIEGMRDLRHVVPPPSLVAGVMARLAEQPPQTFWTWLLRPRRFQLRLSPAGLAGLVLAAGAFLLVLARMPDPRPAPSQALVVNASAPAGVAAAAPVLVRFVLTAKGAHKVALSGDFNDWSTEGTMLEGPDAEGNFVATVPLAQGEHEYMFVVDGRWVTDPRAAERRPDGYGRENSLLRL